MFTFDFTVPLSKLAQLLTDYINYLLQLLQYVINWLIDAVVTALNVILQLIPGCNCVAVFQDNWHLWQVYITSNDIQIQLIFNGIIYLLTMMQVLFGVKLIMCAYSVRFLIRRLPFVG